jgi:site-specific DNA recombinase
MGDRKAGAPNVHADSEQVKEVTAEAKRMGIRVRMLAPELDVSGGLPINDRPSLRDAVEGVEQSKYGGIIVAYLSRLGRNVREQLQVWDRVEAAGGRIIVVRERIDTSTPSGRYIRTILAANDERELEEYTERFERLREWATAVGVWQQPQTPRGYRKDPVTRKLVPDMHAEQIRRTFRSRGAGETISSLARDLGMTQSGARALLRNRVYLGELRLGKYVNRTAHEPLITEEEWLAAQRLRSSRPGRTEEFPALLAGLVRCASCGHIMSRSRDGRNGGTYACHVQHSGGRCTRPVGITHGPLDQYVEEVALVELANLKPTAAKSDRDITAAQRTLIQAERELAAYLEGVSAADLAPRQYAEGARQRREAVDDARERVGELLDRRPGLVDGDPIAAWKRMHRGQRNRLLRSLIECIIVAPVGRGNRVPVGERVRVIKHGTGLVRPYRGGGARLPIRDLGFPEPDDPVVLRVHLPENLLERPRG